MNKLPQRITLSFLAFGIFGATALASALVIDAPWTFTGQDYSEFGSQMEADFIVQMKGSGMELEINEGLAIGAFKKDKVFVFNQADIAVAGDIDYSDAWVFEGLEDGEAGWSLQGGTFAGLGSLAIGAPSERVGKGRVYVLDFISGDVADDYVVATIIGENKVEYLGWDMAAGDFDNDGNQDLAVGAPGYEGFLGAVYVFHGPLKGEISVDDADIVIHGTTHQGVFGHSLAAAQMDAGWTDDLIVGGYQESNIASGLVHIFFDPADGVFDDTDIADQYRITGDLKIENLGWSMDAGKDLDGDGMQDLIIGAPQYWCNYNKDKNPAQYLNSHCNGGLEGTVYIVRGSSKKWDTDALASNSIGAIADGSLTGTQQYGALGYNVSMVGDTNGDGVQDFYAGGLALDKGYIASGNIGHIDVDDASMRVYEDADATHFFGSQGGYIGDLNDDGLDEVMMGAKGSKWPYDAQQSTPSVYIWKGE